MPNTQASTNNSPTWNGRAILTDTVWLPYSHCALLDGAKYRFIAYGHSEEEAIDRLIEKLEEAAHRCPQCDSANTTIEAYDFGTDRETGYRDEGEAIHCLDCGAREKYDPLGAIIPRELPRAKPARQGEAA